MNLTELFETKRQELARVEQREAFLRSQLEEAVQVRLRLVGQLELLQQMYQEQAAPGAPPEEVANGRNDT